MLKVYMILKISFLACVIALPIDGNHTPKHGLFQPIKNGNCIGN